MENLPVNDNIEEKINALPANMKVADVAKFLGLSMTTTYKLVKSADFPVLKMNNIRRVIIPKNRFLAWYHKEHLEHPE